MSHNNIVEMASEFADLVVRREEALCRCDVDANTRLFKIIGRLFEQFKASGVQLDVYENLVARNIPAVSLRIGALMLESGYSPAESVVQDVADNDQTLVGIDANDFLTLWRAGRIPLR